MTAVAQVVNSLDIGGAERIAVTLAEGLVAPDCRSHVIATRRSGALEGALPSDVGFFNVARQARLDWAGIRRLGRYVDEHEIQLLHIHDRATALVVRLSLLFSKERPLQVLHDHSGQAIDDPKAAMVKRFLLRHLAGVMAVSEGLRQQDERLLRLPPERCVFIPNGIPVSPPTECADTPPTVIQVANLRVPKGHATAMRAAAQVRERIPDLRWLCIGRTSEDPDYLQAVERQIAELELADCVQLLGEQDDVRGWLRKAHVGVLSSDFEGLPLSVLEYMAESLPVVATNVGQVPALLNESQGGTTVAVGDSPALAEQITRFLKSRELRQRSGAAGRLHVAEYFSVERMQRQVKEFYAELYAERGRPIPISWQGP